MDNFLKNSILFGLLAFSSFFSSISLAGGISNNICNDARDYMGCMRFHNKEKDKEDFSKIKESRLIYLDKLRKCILSSESSAEIRSCRFKSFKSK